MFESVIVRRIGFVLVGAAWGCSGEAANPTNMEAADDQELTVTSVPSTVSTCDSDKFLQPAKVTIASTFKVGFKGPPNSFGDINQNSVQQVAKSTTQLANGGAVGGKISISTDGFDVTYGKGSMSKADASVTWAYSTKIALRPNDLKNKAGKAASSIKIVELGGAFAPKMAWIDLTSLIQKGKIVATSTCTASTCEATLQEWEETEDATWYGQTFLGTFEKDTAHVLVAKYADGTTRTLAFEWPFSAK